MNISWQSWGKINRDHHEDEQDDNDVGDGGKKKMEVRVSLPTTTTTTTSGGIRGRRWKKKKRKSGEKNFSRSLVLRNKRETRLTGAAGGWRRQSSSSMKRIRAKEQELPMDRSCERKRETGISRQVHSHSTKDTRHACPPCYVTSTFLYILCQDRPEEDFRQDMKKTRWDARADEVKDDEDDAEKSGGGGEVKKRERENNFLFVWLSVCFVCLSDSRSNGKEMRWRESPALFSLVP